MNDDPTRDLLSDPDPLGADESSGSRWRPLRSGIINLFKYDNEVFPFVKGRLLLRGNNGSGKSRVLALQLPFLLEGDIASYRVEPDDDPAKRFEWHLLMGRDGLSSRTGYTWMEFGRRDAEGRALFCTLGCGLKINRGGKLDRWHFITDQRIGRDLRLIRDDNTPVPKDLLKAELTGHGLVYGTSRDYARAVDEHLFHVGEQGGVREERYKALLDLLVELRRPQLSRELDEKKINRILASALPAPDPSMLEDVANGFEGLERDRLELKIHEESEKAVAGFIEVHEAYLRYAVTLRSAELTAAHNRHDRDRRQLADDRAACDTAFRTRDDAVRAEAAAHGAFEDAQARKNALLQSPGMKVAARLEELRGDAEAKATEAARVDAEVTGAEREYVDAQAAQARAAAATEKSRDEAAGVLTAFREAAEPLAVAVPSVDAGADHAAAAREKKAGDAALATLERYGRDLRREREGVRKKEDAAKQAIATRQTQESRHDEALGRVADAGEKRRIAADALRHAAARWMAELRELRVADVDATLDALAAWTETLDGDNPLRQAVQAAERNTTDELAKLRTLSEANTEKYARERAMLEEERAALELGRTPEPPPPYWRDAAMRTNPERPGMPLWRGCDFREDVSESDRAGYEAALEASGLLDAWLTPDGAWIGRDGDVYLDTRRQTPAPDGGLGRVLRFAPDPDDVAARALDARMMEAALAAIGRHADAPGVAAWVDADGRWRNGALAGRHRKPGDAPRAEYLGAGAQAERRRRRLAAIGEATTTLDRLLADEENARALLEERRQRADREQGKLPPDEPLRAAVQSLTAEEGTARREKIRLEDCLRREKEALSQVEDARRAYAARAEVLGLTAWMERLGAFDEAIRTCRSRLDALDRAWLAWRNALQHQVTADHHGSAALRRLDAGHARQRQARGDADAARRAHDALQEVSGHEADEARDQLRELNQRIRKTKTAWEEAGAAKDAALLDAGAKEQKAKDQEGVCAASEKNRDTALERFRTFLRTDVLRELAVPGGDLPPDAAMTALLQLARQTDGLVPEHERSDRAWTRLKNQLTERFEILKAGLSAQDMPTSMELRDDVHIVEVKYNGALRRVGDVRGMLRAEIADRRRILTERERELLENHLVGEVADHLHQRIHEAHALVTDMNAELEHRRTSTGMQLRFDWGVPESAGDSGTETEVRAACAILARRAAAWTPDERRDLAGFLQARIRDTRLDDEALSWRESVARAVDYRPWHFFRVSRRQDKIWQPLTKKTHGTGSGGEKAVALTIPLFAAAAAHYHNAPLAPRLIMLDEAFAGIDRDMVNECMGLLTKFDLDFVMTSEREWGTYPSIDGLSICWLSVHPDYDGIDVSHWRWEGHGTPRRMDAAPGLFARSSPPMAGTNTGEPSP